MKVFVSYSRKDIRRVDGLVDLLKALGHDPFRDSDDIQAGDDWRARLDAELYASEVVVVFWTWRSAKSTEVKREYCKSIARGINTFAIQCDATPVPEPLKSKQFVKGFELVGELLDLQASWQAEGFSRRQIRKALMKRLADAGVDLKDRSQVLAFVTGSGAGLASWLLGLAQFRAGWSALSLGAKLVFGAVLLAGVSAAAALGAFAYSSLAGPSSDLDEDPASLLTQVSELSGKLEECKVALAASGHGPGPTPESPDVIGGGVDTTATRDTDPVPHDTRPAESVTPPTDTAAPEETRPPATEYRVCGVTQALTGHVAATPAKARVVLAGHCRRACKDSEAAEVCDVDRVRGLTGEPEAFARILRAAEGGFVRSTGKAGAAGADPDCQGWTTLEGGTIAVSQVNDIRKVFPVACKETRPFLCCGRSVVTP